MEKVKDGDRRSSSSRLLVVLSAIMLICFGAVGLAAQTYEPGDKDRKIVTRVDPEYPDALKRLYIGGVVRVEVTVAPNGAVTNTKLLGGSPILGQSTMKAIKQWKYAPTGAQEVLEVKFAFDPHR